MLKAKTKLESSAFSAEEKSQMFARLMLRGCPQSTAYARLFRDGFEEWQLVGVLRLIEEYCASRSLSVPPVLTRDFYHSLPSRTDFKEFMTTKGMCGTTCATRFKNPDFKHWELEGVMQILPDLCRSQKE